MLGPSLFRAPAALTVLAVALTFGAGCGGDDADGSTKVTDPGPNPTGDDPGPNPTGEDPGPHDTSAGPVTVQGTLRLGSSCVGLVTETDEFDLRFEDYAAKKGKQGAQLVDHEGTAVAEDGDTLFVTGWERGEAKPGCGTPFEVDSLNSVRDTSA